MKITSTNDLKKIALAKVRQSINQKTERSEQDIKTALFPLTVATILNLLLLLTLVVR